MKRIWGHVVTLVIAGTAVSAVMPACATNDQSIFVRAALAPSANRQNGACVYTDDPQQAQLFQARMDVGITDSYFSVLIVGNQNIPRGDPQNNRAESNRVHLNGGIVKVTEPDGTVISEFTSYSVGFADPQNNNQPDYGVMGLVVVDAPTSDKLKPLLPNRAVTKTVLINIKVFGQTLGGTDVESGEFQLPMQVCNGCLVDFSSGNDETAPLDQQPNCNKPLQNQQGGGGLPCFRGQDEGTPCQACIGVRKVCDPKVP